MSLDALNGVFFGVQWGKGGAVEERKVGCQDFGALIHVCVAQSTFQPLDKFEVHRNGSPGVLESHLTPKILVVLDVDSSKLAICLSHGEEGGRVEVGHCPKNQLVWE